MDDIYAINLAKTHYQEGWNAGDIERLFSVISDAFIDMSNERPSFYFAEAKQALRGHFQGLHDRYEVRLDVTIIDVQVAGDTALDLGWESWTLTPKAGGTPIAKRSRYLETWRREADGQWRIAIFLNNADLPPVLLMAS
jgi:ketosteroid isomerase-like protein